MNSTSTLFPYQEAVIPDVLRSLRPDNPTLLVAPTGSGKTIMAAEIALHFRTVLLVAHRTEIVEQARTEMGKNVQCMSIHQALHHGPPQVDLLIIDEAHRSMASTYREIVKKYQGAAVLGLTATPRRTDGQGLIDVFDEIVECSSVKELVESGHLVPYFALEAPDEALSQLAAMKKQRGDYVTRELSALMNCPRLVGDVVREYKKHGTGRKAVAFAVSIDHSKAMTEAFIATGIRAAHLDGRAPKAVREAALKDLAEGRLDVLCNVNLFTEGWDCPSVSCVIMARPTASLTLYLQSVGRGMRTSPGKESLLILDHAGNIERHGEPDEKRAWSLESEAQRAKREAEIAELERLHALGYESLEAELEDKKRYREATYSTQEASSVLCIVARRTFCNLMEDEGIAFGGSGPQIRYSKADIDALSHKRNVTISTTYSLKDCISLLQMTNGGVKQALRYAGIGWVMITAFRGEARGSKRYPKAEVDQYLERRKSADVRASIKRPDRLLSDRPKRYRRTRQELLAAMPLK